MSNDPYLTDSLGRFLALKSLAERAMEQVTDEEFFKSLDWDGNSIGILVKHIAGNLHSRWTDFLTSDGEKPTRNRDGEFVREAQDTRRKLMRRWTEGWDVLVRTLGGLETDDLAREVTIRGERYGVIAAINRQLAHYGYHVGQIVLLARHFRTGHWETLSIARGESEDFNQEMRAKHEPE